MRKMSRNSFNNLIFRLSQSYHKKKKPRTHLIIIRDVFTISAVRITPGPVLTSPGFVLHTCRSSRRSLRGSRHVKAIMASSETRNRVKYSTT